MKLESFLSDLSSRLVDISLESYIRCKIILIVSVNGMLVKRDASDDTILNPPSNNFLGILSLNF